MRSRRESGADIRFLLREKLRRAGGRIGRSRERQGERFFRNQIGEIFSGSFTVGLIFFRGINPPKTDADGFFVVGENGDRVFVRNLYDFSANSGSGANAMTHARSEKIEWCMYAPRYSS